MIWPVLRNVDVCDIGAHLSRRVERVECRTFMMDNSVGMSRSGLQAALLRFEEQAGFVMY